MNAWQQITNEFRNITDIDSVLILLSSVMLLLLFQHFIVKGKINIELKLTFLKYLPWALVQQLLVVISCKILFTCVEYQILYSAILFSTVYHFPNWRLMLVTLLYAVIFYPIYYINYFNVVFLSIVHALAGSILSLAGFEMRAWFAYWNRKG